MSGTVQIAAVVVIAACAINIVLHLMQKNKGFINYLLTIINVVFIAAAVFCLVNAQTVEPSPMSA